MIDAYIKVSTRDGEIVSVDWNGEHIAGICKELVCEAEPGTFKFSSPLQVGQEMIIANRMKVLIVGDDDDVWLVSLVGMV